MCENCLSREVKKAADLFWRRFWGPHSFYTALNAPWFQQETIEICHLCHLASLSFWHTSTKGEKKSPLKLAILRTPRLDFFTSTKGEKITSKVSHFKDPQVGRELNILLIDAYLSDNIVTYFKALFSKHISKIWTRMYTFSSCSWIFSRCLTRHFVTTLKGYLTFAHRFGITTSAMWGHNILL